MLVMELTLLTDSAGITIDDDTLEDKDIHEKAATTNTYSIVICSVLHVDCCMILFNLHNNTINCHLCTYASNFMVSDFISDHRLVME